MTVVQTLIIILIVWLLGALKSIQLRALAYSLPLPMTVVLLSDRESVSAGHLLGVLLLVFFFRLTQALQAKLGRIFIAIALSLSVYLVAAASIARLPAINFWVALVVAGISLCGLILCDRRSPAGAARVQTNLWSGRRFGVIATSACVAALVGDEIGPFVATFPYSGIPSAVDAKDYLDGMSQNVTINAVALLAFFTGIYLAQGWVSFVVSLLCGWLSFAVIAFVTNVIAWAVRRCSESEV